MSQFHRQKSIKQIKDALIHLVASLLVMFALADISILQAYHGNEAIGINAKDHTSQENHCADEKSQIDPDQVQQDSISQFGDGHGSKDRCSDETECLAGCCHVAVCYFLFDNHFDSETLADNNPLLHEETTPKFHPTDIFHPPQAI